MALDADVLNAMEHFLAVSEKRGAVAMSELRIRFPGLSFTRCAASDIPEAPYRSFAGLDLHLVDGREHCWRITGDPDQATGVILAEHARSGR